MSKDKTAEKTTSGPALKDEVLAMSAKLEKAWTVDKKTGAGTPGETNVYEELMPEGVTPEIAKAVGDYNTTFIAAGAHAFGKLSVAAMKSNKALEQTTIEVPMAGKDSVAYTVDRKKEHVNHLGGNGDKVEKFGVVTTSYNVRAGKNGGQLKAARNLIGELAMEALK